MLRVGIPRYRLPKEILNSEIDAIKEMGVEIKDQCAGGVQSTHCASRGMTQSSLLWEPTPALKMHVDGEESQGVMDCVSLLRDVSLGKKCRIGERVAIVGGGNAAIDASRTALRLGARDVIDNVSSHPG
jgi:NADPH-dependent glutamate synthase beta subunit-like oxidoreductase